MSEEVWRIRYLQGIVVGEVYRSAHDNRTYVARYEGRAGFYLRPYGVKFRFKTKQQAVAWLRRNKEKVRAEAKEVAKQLGMQRQKGRK